MKTLLFSISLIIFSLYTSAQSWCAPNTVFYRDFFGDFNYPGYIKYSFSNTTTVNNLPCQVILTEKKNHSYSNIIGIVTTTSNLVTNFNNGVVSRYNQNTTNFDTIYNFNATIGDKWSLSPKNHTTCAKSRVTVAATGTQVIQGISLKWLKVDIAGYSIYNMNTPTMYTDTIFEKFGSKKYDFFEAFNLCPWASDGFSGGKLRCFNDNQLVNYSTGTIVCNYFYIPPVGLNENEVDAFQLFPNPVSGTLVLKLSNSNTQPYKINLQNTLGQIVLQKQLEPTGNELELDVNDLPKGIYFLKLTGANNQSFTQKIIKE